MNNLYHVLGISSTATGEEIKRAYRRLSKKYHPDANPGDEEAKKRFQEAAEAYRILQDPQKRKEYDQKLQNGRKQSESINYSDLFRTPAGHGQKTRTNPIDVTDLFERYMGIRK